MQEPEPAAPELKKQENNNKYIFAAVLVFIVIIIIRRESMTCGYDYKFPYPLQSPCITLKYPQNGMPHPPPIPYGLLG